MLTVVPLPYSVDLDDHSFQVSKNISWDLDNATDPVARQAFNSFQEWADQSLRGEAEWSISLQTETDAPATPSSQMNESYTLLIDESRVTLQANNGIGIERGLQTLRQLVNQGQMTTLQTGEIYDEPRYAWRGLMIDIARKWIPKTKLIENIDAMAAAKLNVLHLHLSDDQAHRVESLVYPQLHQQSSRGNYLSQVDIKELVKYAGLRGIRIVPEFDMPSHMSSWIAAYPELGSSSEPVELIDQYGVYPHVINPINGDTYVFLAKFIQEMAGLFPDQYIHIGGEEVIPNQWVSNPDIVAFMKDKGLNNPVDLQAYFTLRVDDILNRAGKRMMGRDDILHPNLVKNNALIQVWRSREAAIDAINAGHSIVQSKGWELDQKPSLSRLYANDPETLPASMTINADSTDWQAYQLSIQAPGTNGQKGVLFLFGQKTGQVSGILNYLNQNHVFESGSIADGQLRFEYESHSGPVLARMQLSDDALSGDLFMSFATMNVAGELVGGDDRETGIMLPRFVKSAPPTEAALARIIGGEATLWSEWVSPANINSRLWPSALAVAEKLWSPKSHTTDADDLYRRTAAWMNQEYISTKEHQLVALQKAGLNAQEIVAMNEFINLLEEVKYYGRWSTNPQHSINSPLDGLADLAPVESIKARAFKKEVAAYVATPTEAHKNKLIKTLQRWISIYPIIAGKLKSSSYKYGHFELSALRDLSALAMKKLQGKTYTPEDLNYYKKLIPQLYNGSNGYLLAPAGGLIQLIES